MSNTGFQASGGWTEKSNSASRQGWGDDGEGSRESGSSYRKEETAERRCEGKGACSRLVRHSRGKGWGVFSRVGNRAQNLAHRDEGSENEPDVQSRTREVGGLEGDTDVSPNSAMPRAQQDWEMEGSPRRKGKRRPADTHRLLPVCQPLPLRSEPAHQQREVS